MRATFLVVEPEPGHALSTRKLVLETAKFNVITAHSWDEANLLFERFPKVDAVIVTNEVDEGVPCDTFVQTVKKRNSETKVIALTPNAGAVCSGADHHMSTHEPHSLVEFLRSEFGDPRPNDA